MQKKLTITIDEDVYAGLYRVVGKRKISRFIESLVRPHVIHDDRDSAHRGMAANTEWQTEAGIGIGGGLDKDVSIDRGDASTGPVFITGGDHGAHVILTVEDYLNMAGQDRGIVELLAMPEAADIDFELPRLDSELYRKSELP